MQHLLKAALYGASNGLGQLIGVAPSMSAAHVMLASELGVTVSILGVGLGLVLKNMPRQCRLLKAKYWPNNHDIVRMPSEEAGSWWPNANARSISSHSHLTDSMLVDEALHWHPEADLRVTSVL